MNDRNEADAGRFKARDIGKDIFIYAAGNGLLVIFGFLQSLIIPKFLTITGYGYWQLFTLYGYYMGILHLGLLDGLLVRWAGKDINEIGGELQTAVKFLVFEQLMVIIPLGMITYFVLHPPLQWIGLLLFANAFIQNLTFLFIFVAQATRQFRLLTLLSVAKGFVFLLFVGLLYISGHLEYQSVIMVFLASSFLFLFAFAIRYRGYLYGDHSPVSALVSFGKINISAGILILLGNHIFGVFCTLDGLMVSYFFTIEQFAVYAFAMAVAQLVFIFIRAIADVLFPHLSAAAPEHLARAYQLGKRALIICWGIALCAYFPLAEFIQYYLPSYTGSLPIIKILMGTIGISSLIFILQVNYYRLYRKQRQYFGVGITALAFAVLLALAAIKVLGTVESVAIAIQISFFVWYIINELSLKAVSGESNGKIWRSLIIMGCYFACFWLSSALHSWFIAQMLIYAGFFLVISFGFFSADIAGLISMVRKSRANRS